MKDKIAIVGPRDFRNIGGTSTYIRDLIEVLKDHYEIHYFYAIKSSKGRVHVTKDDYGIKIHDVSAKFAPYPIKYYRMMKKISKDQSFKCIINNSRFVTKKILRSEKTALVQHEDFKFYNDEIDIYKNNLSDNIKEFIDRNFLRISIKRKEILKNASNIVVYDKMCKHLNVGNYHYVPLATHAKGEINLKRSGIVWAARLDEKMKLIRILSNIYDSSSFRNEFEIYGNGPDIDILMSLPIYKKYKGALPHDKMLDRISKAKVLILTSRTEGFSYSVLDAMAAGVPVVLFDTYDMVKKFKTLPGVFAVDPYDIKTFNEYIEKIYSMPTKEYNEMCENLAKQSREMFSIEGFQSQWLKIIEKIKA